MPIKLGRYVYTQEHEREKIQQLLIDFDFGLFFNGWGEFLNCYVVILHFRLKVSERFYIHVSSETTTPPAADEVVEILAEVAKFLIEKEKQNRCN